MNKQIIKESGIEGIRVGLIAFLITFGVSLIMSLTINLIWLDDINRILNGSLSTDPEVTGSSILMLTSMVLNMSLFNSGGELAGGGHLHIGVLSFALLPAIAFIIADRRDNKQKSFDFHDMVIYIASSLSFGIAVYVFSLITKGEFIGMAIDYTVITNLLMTFVIAMFIQLLIGLNYNKQFSPGVKYSRLLFRSFMLIGLVVGLISMVVLFTKFLGGALPFIVILLIALLMLPNVAVYILFTFMGGSVQFGDQLHTLFYEYFQIDLGFAALPLVVKIIMVVLFFGLVLMSAYRIEEKNYLRQIGLFGISFSFLTLILSYCTQVNLGIVKSWIGVQFGYDSLYVFVMPLVVIFLAGGLVFSFRRLHQEIKK